MDLVWVSGRWVLVLVAGIDFVAFLGVLICGVYCNADLALGLIDCATCPALGFSVVCVGCSFWCCWVLWVGWLVVLVLVSALWWYFAVVGDYDAVCFIVVIAVCCKCVSGGVGRHSGGLVAVCGFPGRFILVWGLV